MAEGKPQRPIPSHGNASNRASTTLLRGLILRFNVRNKFLHEKVAVSHLSIYRVDIESLRRVRSSDEELPDLALPSQFVQHGPAAIIEKLLLVTAEPMQV